MVALIERRIWTPLDYRRDRHHAGTHSDALRTAAQAVPVPQLSQRWPARRFANVKVLTATADWANKASGPSNGPLSLSLSLSLSFFVSVFGHMKGRTCQRGSRRGQTDAMVYRLGISM